MTEYSAIGVDLGDNWSYLCGLDAEGEVILEDRERTTPDRMISRFSSIPATVVAIEAGSLSGWVSRILKECGHSVIVANPRQIPLLTENAKKCDRTDAETLARMARADPKLLKPIQHRSKQAHADLMIIRSRDLLVRTRTKMICHVRSLLKSFGIRVPSCSAAAFHNVVETFIPQALSSAVVPIVAQIKASTETIRKYDKHIDKLAKNRYPDTANLRQVGGVGSLTTLAFVLTIEDPSRFRKSRQVGTFFGICPRSSRSSQSNPQLRISKEGNGYVRRLLIGSAHYILGPFGPPCYLREWGQKIMQRGGPNARKRAAVAVARRLAVLLHRLWITGEKYDPFRNSTESKRQEAILAASLGNA